MIFKGVRSLCKRNLNDQVPWCDYVIIDHKGISADSVGLQRTHGITRDWSVYSPFKMKLFNRQKLIDQSKKVKTLC